MAERIVTKVGDIFRTTSGQFIQLVAIDPIAMNSDVVVVYKDGIELDHPSSSDIEFYLHTTVRAGVKQGLWKKVGKASVPDISKLTFKLFNDKETVELANLSFGILRRKVPHYFIWKLGDDDMKKISERKGRHILAEEGVVIPPKMLLERINGL